MQGDTIVIEYNGRLYHIDVLETKPEQAIMVIETDVTVEFAPPKDYKEPEWKRCSDSSPVPKHSGESLKEDQEHNPDFPGMNF